ncbi:hypothetical protein B296_00044979 [Ensete ventricosum]|uniref:Uncharacterized protein n=1 Tax=Ensete ventricosum TaxID=4639 RepID=A0A426YP49_ENSVE|nr:hypothetical protein B296_00044979 [Ensete ventricosum]
MLPREPHHDHIDQVNLRQNFSAGMKWSNAGLCECRFGRNAGVVASGVAKNLNKVGNYIKDNIDDIFYPYRKPPK